MVTFKKWFSIIMVTLFISSVISIKTPLHALDLERVVLSKEGHQLTTAHILAFFAYLQSEGEMKDEPTEEEIFTATNVAKTTFKQNPALFVQRMNEVFGVKPSSKQQKSVLNSDLTKPSTSEIENKSQNQLQQEAMKIYPQYKLRFQSVDINALFQQVNGVRFSNTKINTTRSSREFRMTTELREDIHFCNNGRLYMVNHSKAAGGGNANSFLSGSGGGEITVDALWGLAQLPNNSLILMLKMGQAPVSLLPIKSDRVRVQLDNKVFSQLGKSDC